MLDLLRGLLFLLLAGAFLGVALAVQHIGPRHVVLAGSHQRQFDLILDILDMYRPTIGQAAGQGAHDGFGETSDHFAHTRRGGALATFDRQEGLGHGHRDLLGIKGDHRAITADDLKCGKGRLTAGVEG